MYIYVYTYTYRHENMYIVQKKFKQFEENSLSRKVHYCRKLLSVHRHFVKFLPLQIHLTHKANSSKYFVQMLHQK